VRGDDGGSLDRSILAQGLEPTKSVVLAISVVVDCGIDSKAHSCIQLCNFSRSLRHLFGDLTVGDVASNVDLICNAA